MCFYLPKIIYVSTGINPTRTIYILTVADISLIRTTDILTIASTSFLIIFIYIIVANISIIIIYIIVASTSLSRPNRITNTSIIFIIYLTIFIFIISLSKKLAHTFLASKNNTQL